MNNSTEKRTRQDEVIREAESLLQSLKDGRVTVEHRQAIHSKLKDVERRLWAVSAKPGVKVRHRERLNALLYGDTGVVACLEGVQRHLARLDRLGFYAGKLIETTNEALDLCPDVPGLDRLRRDLNQWLLPMRNDYVADDGTSQMIILGKRHGVEIEKVLGGAFDTLLRKLEYPNNKTINELVALLRQQRDDLLQELGVMPHEVGAATPEADASIGCPVPDTRPDRQPARQDILNNVHTHLDFFRPQWAEFCTWADECADQWHRYEEEQNGKYLRASGELESKLEDAGKPDTAESKEIQKALDEVKDEWKKSRKLYQSERRGDLPKAGWRYARCPEWFRHRGLTFYVPDDLDDFTDLFLMIDGPAAKLSDEKQLVRHCALLAVAHDTCLALAPGEPRICDWQAYGQSHFDFEGFMAAVKRSLRERLPGGRYRRDEELCRAYDRIKPHLPDAKTTNPPAGLMIGPDHKPVDPVKSYTRHAPLNAAMNDLAPKLCEVAAGVNADPPARAGGSENAGQKPEAPVTLREFMREYCEPLGNALLESRLTSLQSLWRRKKDIAPEHVTPWRPGQSKKYKPSTLIGIWPTCKEESTGLPDLEKTSE